MWMVSIHRLFPKSSSPWTCSLMTVPSAPITIGITVFFMFPSFLKFSSKVLVLIFLFAFLQFHPVVNLNDNFTLESKYEGYLTVFYWSLSDSKSQVSRTLLSILADLNNAEVWMVSIRLFSKSSSRWASPLDTVPSAPITISPSLSCLLLLLLFYNERVFPRILIGGLSVELQASTSISMHAKRNTCALIKKATFSH